VCAVAGETGAPKHLRGAAKPSLESVRDLLARARSMVGHDEVWLTIEAGAPIWIRLFHQAGAVVHVVDPKRARRFVESQGSAGGKDDRRDAASMADLCRSERHRPSPWRPDSAELQQLDALAGLHEQVSRDLGRTKQRLREELRRQMPLVEKALPKDLCSAWVSKFLKEAPTPWHAKRLSRATVDELMKAAAPATRERMWEALQNTEAPWLLETVAPTVAYVVHSDLEQIALFSRQLEEIERRLDAVTESMATRELAESMGGVALLMAATLIQFAFRDGVPKDRDQASIRMGASPVFVGSAKDRKGRTKGHAKMRRAADSRARRATYLLGRLAMQRLRWAGEMYKDARKRGQSAATAFRRIARCVLRIQTAMVRTGQPYDEERYVATLKAKGVPWAVAL
jgi:hypothetical protein